MDIAAEFRRCMVEMDAPGIRRVWSFVSPNMPAPVDDDAAMIALHMARTATESIPLKLRAYSHAWLGERELPSQLPDRLKASAERLYPRVVEAVGISVNFSSLIMKPAASLVRGAMETAVNDAFADGMTDPEFVSARMREAKEREMGKLFGRMGVR